MYLCDEEANVDRLRNCRDDVGERPSSNFFEQNNSHVCVIDTNRMVDHTNAKFRALQRCDIGKVSQKKISTKPKFFYSF